MRVLNAESTQGDMSIDKCLGFCAAFGFGYAGLINGDTCFCDTAKRQDYGSSNMCTKPCTGDIGTNCGGEYKLCVDGYCCLKLLRDIPR